MSRIYALLVGINDYPSPVPKLEGCVNDVDAFEDYLSNRLNTKQYQLHLKRLTTNGEDDKPTREAVIAGFEQHLCQATKHDVALFYFSGHGSQEVAPPEFWHLKSDRMNETLVCLDSRTSERDLADKELNYLISKVAKNNPHIIVILDSCHSGSGTRDVVPKKGVRHAPADRRPRSLEEFIFPLEALEAIQMGSAYQATTDEPSGWNLPQVRHILLSACRDSESATEYEGDGKPRGAFSYFLLDTLNKTNGSLTYRELFKRSSALVRSRVKDQSPQLESTLSEDRELYFLGTKEAISKHEPHYTLSHTNNRWEIDGGAVHGIPQNTYLALYPLGTAMGQMRNLSTAIGEIKVIEVRPNLSIVEIITPPDELTNDTVLNAVVTSLPLPPMGVYFEGDREALNLARQELNTMGKSSIYVREVEDTTEAEYRLLAQDGQYIITKPSNARPLVRQLEDYTQTNAHKAIENLEDMARWTDAVRLEGTPGSRIPADAVKMQFYLDDGTEITDSPLRLSYQYQDGKWKPATFRVKLTNTTEERLFCTLIDLPEDYSISPDFFEGNNRGVWIEPGDEVWALNKTKIAATLPNELQQQGVTEYQDILKLIVSTAEFDASLMRQDGLEQPKRKEVTRSVLKRNSNLNRLMQQITKRHLGAVPTEEVDEWVTSQATIVTVRPRENVTISEDVSVSLGESIGVTIQPHNSLKATARLTTVAQSTRDVKVLLPPILRDNTQPFQFTASRGVDQGLSVLELQLTDVSTLNGVTSEQPLLLSVEKSLQEDEYVLPVAHDGEFFIPLGRGEMKDDTTEICIERLPHPLAEKKKDLQGSIRIFFQKVVAEKLNLEFPYPILAAVEYGEDESISFKGDLESVKQRVAGANKIVLFIHGIIGDTKSIVPCARSAKIFLEGQEKSLSEIYDLVLAFDYENLNTPIGTLAEQLRDRLKAVGLDANHGKTLHIVAHSMGGLVSRSFIEQKGGNQVVQHLIMLGTPNAGSPWSTVQDWATTTLAIGINSLSMVAMPIKIIGSLVAAIEAIDINLDQMKPGSDFLIALRDCADPKIPYTILAGNTSLIQPPEEEETNKIKALLAKLGKSAVEFPFFGQPNDIAVTVQSIKGVPQERSPQATIQEVACDHLVYFKHPDGLQSLAQAVIDTGILKDDKDDTDNSDRQDLAAEEHNLDSANNDSSPEKPKPLAKRPDIETPSGIPTWIIGLVVVLLAITVGGFWLRQQSQEQEPELQENSSQSIINLQQRGLDYV